MGRKLLCTLAASVVSAGIALAQTGPPPEPGAAATPGQSNPNRSDPSTATPGTVDRSVSRAPRQEDSARNSEPDLSARPPKSEQEARVSGLTAGTRVQTPAGAALGVVRDFILDPNSGQPQYVLIETSSGRTAVPYSAVVPLYDRGHILLDRARLESAPHVRNNQLQDRGDIGWKKQADRYWLEGNAPRLR
jgi:hypothetical protein